MPTETRTGPVDQPDLQPPARRPSRSTSQPEEQAPLPLEPHPRSRSKPVSRGKPVTKGKRPTFAKTGVTPLRKKTKSASGSDSTLPASSSAGQTSDSAGQTSDWSVSADDHQWDYPQDGEGDEEEDPFFTSTRNLEAELTFAYTDVDHVRTDSVTTTIGDESVLRVRKTLKERR